MRTDANRLLEAVELIAASTWGTEAALRGLERGDLDDARTFLEDSRRALREGLRDLRRVLDDALVAGDGGPALASPDAVERARDGIVRLHELVAARTPPHRTDPVAS